MVTGIGPGDGFCVGTGVGVGATTVGGTGVEIGVEVGAKIDVGEVAGTDI